MWWAWRGGGCTGGMRWVWWGRGGLGRRMRLGLPGCSCKPVGSIGVHGGNLPGRWAAAYRGLDHHCRFTRTHMRSPSRRRVINDQLAAGSSLEEVAGRLNYTLKQPTPPASTRGTPAGSRAGSATSSLDGGAAAAPARPSGPPPQVGAPLGTPKRNPLDMIKVRAGATFMII